MSDEPAAPPEQPPAQINAFRHLSDVLNHFDRLIMLNSQTIELLVGVAARANLATPELLTKMEELIGAYQDYWRFKDQAMAAARAEVSPPHAPKAE